MKVHKIVFLVLSFFSFNIIASEESEVSFEKIKRVVEPTFLFGKKFIIKQ